MFFRILTKYYLKVNIIENHIQTNITPVELLGKQYLSNILIDMFASGL